MTSNSADIRLERERLLLRALRDLEAHAQALFNADQQAEAPSRDGFLVPVSRGFGDLRRQSTYSSPTAPTTSRAVWAVKASAPERTKLPVYPGHGSALLQVKPHLNVGYIVDDDDPGSIATLVRSVFLAQRSKRLFAPLFITSSTHFTPFLRHGYIFEYLLPRHRFSAGAGAYEVWRQKRIQSIIEKWDISHVIESSNAQRLLQVSFEAGHKSRVVVYPDYAHANPYIRIMYAGLRDEYNCSFGPADQAAKLAQREPVTFHLHWEDAVFRNLRVEDAPAVMAGFIASIDRLKALGGRFFWTMHNLEAHDAVDQELGREFTNQLLMRADCIHVHSAWAAGKVARLAPSGANIVTIEHPSYANCYPERTSRSTARASLGLDDDRSIFLCFGNIRRYKGIETLINVAPRFADRAKFIIAGRSGPYDPRAAPPENCLCIDGHIDDETLSRLHSAADFAIMPFEQITTSGSLMLALSFGLPVVAPSHDGLTSVIQDGRQGFLYAPDDRQGLADAIERALQAPEWLRNAMGQYSAATAALRPPTAFAAAIREMYVGCNWPPRRWDKTSERRSANTSPSPVLAPQTASSAIESDKPQPKVVPKSSNASTKARSKLQS